MSNTDEKKLVPKLRFPEFRDAGEWEERLLKNICQMQSGKFVSASEIIENKSDYLYPCYGGNGLRGYTRSFTHIGKFPLIGRQGALCGNVMLAKGKFHATEHAVVATTNDGFDTEWLFYLLVKLNLNQYATGQAQPGLSVENLEKININIPRTEKEQQKIADCLSSLDDLITANTQKLDALKTHKKGLMQQLFPAAGETVPKLRFKEFEDSGEWEEKELGEIAEFFKGKGISKSDINDEGTQPCIRYGELYTHYGEIIKKIRSFTHLSADELMLSEEDDVILPSSGETKEDIATASCVKLKGVALGGDLIILRSKLNGEFFAYYLSHNLKKTISRIAQGDAVVHLYSTQLKKLQIRVPTQKEEQQKIADCLSSLDELITAQTQKIEVLKLHKKGLLQQLFPSINNTTNA